MTKRTLWLMAVMAALAIPTVAEARGINHKDVPLSLGGGYATLNTHVPKAVQAAELAAAKHATYGAPTGARGSNMIGAKGSKHEHFGADFGAPIIRVR
jgi:hypothetical protein